MTELKSEKLIHLKINDKFFSKIIFSNFSFIKVKLKTQATTLSELQKTKRRLSISEEEELDQENLPLLDNNFSEPKCKKSRNRNISHNNNNENAQKSTESSKENINNNNMASVYNSRNHKELYAPKLQKSMEINYMTTLMDNLDEYRTAFRRFAHGADKLPQKS